MSVNVARIYEHTIRPGHFYCRICLRTREETTLVAPRNLLQFSNALKLNIFDSKKEPQACYLCEASAGTALRLYQACVNAVSVKTVCQPLKTMKADDAVPDWLRKAILGCNANLREYRQRTRLLQTEVLVVDSVGIEWKSQVLENSTSDDTLPTNLPSPQPLYETVVLDDDDDEAPAENTATPLPNNLPRIVPIEKLLDLDANDRSVAALLPNQMQIISRHETDKKNFILHPVVLGDNGTLLAPSLGGVIKDGQLVFAANVFQTLPMVDCTMDKSGLTYLIQNSILQPTKDAMVMQQPTENDQGTQTETELIPDKSKRNKHVRYYGTNERHKVLPSPANDMESKLKRYLETRDDDECCTKKRNNNFYNNRYVVDLDTVNNMILNTGDSEPIAIITNVKSESVGDHGTGVDSLSNGEVGVMEVVSRAPTLVEKAGKIDWEDKIPMDVISFVDATDPNDAALIVPDLPTPTYNSVPKSADPPVIDLC